MLLKNKSLLNWFLIVKSIKYMILYVKNKLSIIINIIVINNLS